MQTLFDANLEARDAAVKAHQKELSRVEASYKAALDATYRNLMAKAESLGCHIQTGPDLEGFEFDLISQTLAFVVIGPSEVTPGIIIEALGLSQPRSYSGGPGVVRLVQEINLYF